MEPVTAKQAFQSLISGRPHSGWAAQELDDTGTYQITYPGNGGHRIFKTSPAPILKPKFTLPLAAGVFSAGSGFAREIEQALLWQKGNVLSWKPESNLVGDLFNRFTTRAIANDFRFAIEDNYDEANVVPYRGRWIDYTSHGIAEDRETLLANRKSVIDTYKRAAIAEFVFLTLGSVEVWRDRETAQFLNIPPWGDLDSDRYTFCVTDYRENRMALEELITSLRATNKTNPKIILAVSAVPMDHTFSGQDIVVANTYSKATLRAVAQDVANGDPLIDYFPSYEMAMLGAPETVWHPDFRNLKRQYSVDVVQAFLRAYLEKTPTADGLAAIPDGTVHSVGSSDDHGSPPENELAPAPHPEPPSSKGGHKRKRGRRR